MGPIKPENEDDVALVVVQKELAQPRLAKAAGILELPRMTMPGTVDKIIPAMGDERPEKAQIAIEGPEDLYRDIRIENSLQNADGDAVSLRVGSKVEVTIEAKSESSIKE
jgi:hypothetical protein